MQFIAKIKAGSAVSADPAFIVTLIRSFLRALFVSSASAFMRLKIYRQTVAQTYFFAFL